MWPSPSNCVPSWPISVARNSSCQITWFCPNGPPVGPPGMRNANERSPNFGIAGLVDMAHFIDLAGADQPHRVEHFFRRDPVCWRRLDRPRPSATATTARRPAWSRPRPAPARSRQSRCPTWPRRVCCAKPSRAPSAPLAAPAITARRDVSMLSWSSWRASYTVFSCSVMSPPSLLSGSQLRA